MAFLERGANRGSVSTGFEIDNSVKVEADNDERFTRTPSSAGNRKTWTFSAWVKRTELGANQILISAADTYLYFGSDDKIHCNFRPASENFFLSTNRLFRDTSAFYHIVVQCDTTDGTAADRAKLYINGVRETSYSSSTYNNMSQNLDTSMNNTIEHMIGRYSSSDDYRMSGYISEFHLVDGTALTPTSFGEFDEDSGIWKPKAYAGAYGTNGFYLDFKDSANLGNDASGGTDFTETNITAADQATDTPTNNFATLNVLNRNSATASNNPTYTEGNTRTTSTLDDYWQTAIATIGVTSGKWYMEGQLIYDPAMAGIGVGDFGDIENWGRNNDNVMAGKAIGYGTPKAEVGDSLPASANDYTNSNIIGVALDADNGKVYWSRDGTYQSSGDPVNGTNGISIPTGGDAEGLYMFGVSGYKATHGSYTGNVGWLVNFGGYTTISISSAATDANGYGTFEYAPPSGYYALCTKNLAQYGG